MLDQKIIDKIEDRLIARFESLALVSETDFLMGAITAIHAITGDDDMNQTPTYWIFHAMANRSVVALVEMRRGALPEKVLRIEKQDYKKTLMLNYAGDLLNMLLQIAEKHDANPTYTSAWVKEKLEEMGFIKIEEDK